MLENYSESQLREVCSEMIEALIAIRDNSDDEAAVNSANMGLMSIDEEDEFDFENEREVS